MLKICNLVELFSGIGSQLKALKNLGVEVNTLGTSEWDIHAIVAYDVIHNSPNIPENIEQMDKTQLLEALNNFTFSNSGKTALDYSSLRTYSEVVLRRIYTSILRNNNFVDITSLNGKQLPDNIDILTYSFPCQDLSNVGAFHGYNKGIDKDSGSRSSLLWQVGRILTEMKESEKKLPRFLLMENVPTLLSKRHYGNFSTWISNLEDLGYVNQYYQLNATSFGLPQNRPRLLMISVYVGDDIHAWRLVTDYFNKKKNSDDIVSDYQSSKYYKQYTVQELLRTNYDDPIIFSEAIECTPNDTVSRQTIWNENPQIVLKNGNYNKDITAVRTITTKQDRNPNSGNLYFDSGIAGKSKFRYLTPRECLLFMGFSDEDYERLITNNAEFHKGDSLFARDKVIRMAGNSIPVKLLEGMFYQILQIDDMLDNYKNAENFQLEEDSISLDYSKLIRSYAFKEGIRSRISIEKYPKNATIVYPKHKTAVYVCCTELFNQSPLCEIHYWKRRFDKYIATEKEKCNEALIMGWNAIFITEYELNDEHKEETLAWIIQCIKNNENNARQGILMCQERT